MRFRSWMLRVSLLMGLVIGLDTLAPTVHAPTTPPASQPAAVMNAVDHANAMPGADVAYAVERGQSEDLVEQAAICLLIPQCFKNSDCDPQCGDGQGRCVHNPCPARVCRCR